MLLLLGVLGVVQFGIPGFLSINEPAEIAVHFVTGALATYAGFSRGYGRTAVLYDRVFGIVYLILCIGFFVPDLLPGLIHFDLGCNLAHLVLGLWGLYAGYFARQTNVAVRGISVLTVESAKITRGLYVWDVAGLLRSIDLLPDSIGLARTYSTSGEDRSFFLGRKSVVPYCRSLAHW